MDRLFGPHVDLSASMGRLKTLMDEEGLPFDEERHMTFNSRLAQELAKWGEGKPQSEQLNIALYQAYFVDGRNIGDREVLLDVVEQVELPVEEAREVLEKRTMRPAVDADWERARRLGVTGVPTFVVGMNGVVGAQPYDQLARFMEHVGVHRKSPDKAD